MNMRHPVQNKIKISFHPVILIIRHYDRELEVILSLVFLKSTRLKNCCRVKSNWVRIHIIQWPLILIKIKSLSWGQLNSILTVGINQENNSQRRLGQQPGNQPTTQILWQLTSIKFQLNVGTLVWIFIWITAKKNTAQSSKKEFYL